MIVRKANKILDTKEMLRKWKFELEDKVNNYPRKISQKEYVKQISRLRDIEESIYYFEEEQKVLSNQSPPVRTSPNGDFSNEKEHNMGDKVSATPTPKDASHPSHHPNINRNKGECL